MKTKSRADSASANLDGSKRVGSGRSGSADFYAEHNILRREGFVTRPGNLHCAFKPGTMPLLCRPVTEKTGKLLLPNEKLSHAAESERETGNKTL